MWEVKETSIYRYGFLNEQFDRILSVPMFSGRDLAEDEKNFMCRETDMVAFENLLLHLSPIGGIDDCASRTYYFFRRTYQ